MARVRLTITLLILAIGDSTVLYGLHELVGGANALAIA